MQTKPNDRLKKNGSSNGNPKIINSINLKIPDKEVHIMQSDEKAPTSGTCSCHSVCSCVPVSQCNCNNVCTCDAVCSTNTCPCNPFTGCPGHSCSCQPVCTTCSTCSTCTTGCSCIPVTYYYPN
jgi:hypothetical protein